METKFLISKCSLIPSEGSSLKENYDIVRGNPIIDYYESVESPSIAMTNTFVDIQKNSDLYNIDIENYYGEIEKLECEWIINASGLDSDVIGNFLGLNVPTLKFLKGSYFKLSSKWRDKFKHLVYHFLSVLPLACLSKLVL